MMTADQIIIGTIVGFIFIAVAAVVYVRVYFYVEFKRLREANKAQAERLQKAINKGL